MVRNAAGSSLPAASTWTVSARSRSRRVSPSLRCAQRATFLVDEEGVVRHVIPKASPKTHDDEVLAALATL